MIKPETLAELVERLDRGDCVWIVNRFYQWPRLRDAIREMREWIDEIGAYHCPKHEGSARKLLARLDKWEPGA